MGDQSIPNIFIFDFSFDSINQSNHKHMEIVGYKRLVREKVPQTCQNVYESMFPEQILTPSE